MSATCMTVLGTAHRGPETKSGGGAGVQFPVSSGPGCSIDPRLLGTPASSFQPCPPWLLVASRPVLQPSLGALQSPSITWPWPWAAVGRVDWCSCQQGPHSPLLSWVPRYWTTLPSQARAVRDPERTSARSHPAGRRVPRPSHPPPCTLLLCGPGTLSAPTRGSPPAALRP